MHFSEILNGSQSKSFNAKLVVLNPDGQGSAAPAKLATGSSAFSGTLMLSAPDDPTFPEGVSQRELSWATLRLLDKIETQLEAGVKAMPATPSALGSIDTQLQALASAAPATANALGSIDTQLQALATAAQATTNSLSAIGAQLQALTSAVNAIPTALGAIGTQLRALVDAMPKASSAECPLYVCISDECVQHMKDAYEGKTVIVSEQVTLESVAITMNEMKNNMNTCMSEVSERLTKLDGLPERVRDMHERITEMGADSRGVKAVAKPPHAQ